ACTFAQINALGHLALGDDQVVNTLFTPLNALGTQLVIPCFQAGEQTGIGITGAIVVVQVDALAAQLQYGIEFIRAQQDLIEPLVGNLQRIAVAGAVAVRLQAAKNIRTRLQLTFIGGLGGIDLKLKRPEILGVVGADSQPIDAVLLWVDIEFLGP